MPAKKLTENDKLMIVTYHDEEIYTQQQIADLFAISPRSVRRVLAEKGCITPTQRFESRVWKSHEVLQKHGFADDPEHLDNYLSYRENRGAIITTSMVQDYLSQLSVSQILKLLWKAVSKKEQLNAQIAG